MNKNRSLLDLAANYNQGLPHRIRQYLNRRGIPDIIIDFHLLGWNGWRITIPIFNRKGEVAFFKLAKDPDDPQPGPKMIASQGGYLELYGWEQVKRKPSLIIICEGEFDRLVLEANRFCAVTSTGGAGAFRFEWAKEFKTISEVYVCFDHDEAGENGALHVARTIPHAKIVELPQEVGKGGDVTDFFVRLGKNREDFLMLLKKARPAPPKPKMGIFKNTAITPRQDSLLSQRIKKIKNEVPIAEVIGQYIKLRSSGNNFVGLCPFHEDHNPSFTVYPSTGTFHCYGCNKHGDVISFLQEIAYLSFSQALDALDQIRSQHESGLQKNH